MGPWRSCPSSAELNPAKLTFKKIFDEVKVSNNNKHFYIQMKYF